VSTDAESIELKKAKVQKFRNRFMRFLYVLTAIVILLWGVSPWVKIGFNGTDSVDGWVFLIVKGQIPEKNELAAFYPPDNDFYQNIWFVKYIKGTEGDVVGWQGQNFYINSELMGEAKPVSRSGVALVKGHAGVIGKGEYFVWTNHKDSFDSRYQQIGWITEDNIIGTAIRIF